MLGWKMEEMAKVPHCAGGVDEDHKDMKGQAMWISEQNIS